MNFEEKSLYQQIHPLKLLTDWGTGIVALYLFWQHALITALLVAFVPSLLVSLWLIRCANLDKYKQSRFGQYVRQHMTRWMQALRLVGYGVMAMAAWYHHAWLMLLGLLAILLAWFRGVLFPFSRDRRGT